MLYLEHIKFSKNGLEFRDKNGGRLSFGEGMEKALNRLFSYIEDLELWIVDSVGWIPVHIFRILVYQGAGMKIGRQSHIHVGARFFNPAGIEIGEGTIVGEMVFLDGRAPLKIGNHVDIASQVLIYNSEHDINAADFQATTASVEIGDYCFIGSRVIILPGVKIGKGAVVAAGAVVTKNVDPFSIVGGVPAQVIGERKIKNPQYNLGRVRLFQ